MEETQPLESVETLEYGGVVAYTEDEHLTVLLAAPHEMISGEEHKAEDISIAWEKFCQIFQSEKLAVTLDSGTTSDFLQHIPASFNCPKNGPVQKMTVPIFDNHAAFLASLSRLLLADAEIQADASRRAEISSVVFSRMCDVTNQRLYRYQFVEPEVSLVEAEKVLLRIVLKPKKHRIFDALGRTTDNRLFKELLTTLDLTPKIYAEIAHPPGRQTGLRLDFVAPSPSPQNPEHDFLKFLYEHFLDITPRLTITQTDTFPLERRWILHTVVRQGFVNALRLLEGSLEAGSEPPNG